MTISISQTNPLPLSLPHPETRPVIKPAVQGTFLEETSVTGMMHELLLRLTKDGEVFWVGAAVPFGTTDFTRLQVFFHPTVVQDRNVIAREEDYPTFTGDWSRTMQRYTALEGAQLAAVRQVPMIVPFTPMAALRGGARNMFSVDPVATLSHIANAMQSAVIPLPIPVPPPVLSAVGVASFSSGISAMRLFVQALQPSGLLREIIDFDSPFIIGEPAALTVSPGAVSSCYTQVPLNNPPPGYRFLPAASFGRIPSYNRIPHSCIGWMMYYSAMITSVVT